ncbi:MULTISPECIES: CPBP family intramembrane glutamic endopeptidase [unclassified Psychrobacter]|uniref:CPBP family intramembrane glutamic endopeptidase n=1 Tax=unclassified Psychrobacter TaxID=196806 RepID=UPI0025B3033F|nr:MULTISPECIES: CPBP family intramembrane glutamic endopeptidase [unclassified Psychrobacter]MDN3454063.1 CPBP family intramembrane metalloprotease [Psychrobacter sp. APC 3350]MDN3503411.1 CPBP family intramembrane metalloprotease [Psychrobacter sp. 5A.1]
MPKNITASPDIAASSELTPLFSRWGTFWLTVGMVFAFFISQLFGVYIAGKLVLPAAKKASIGDIFFFGSNDGTVVSLSILIGCVLLLALSVLIIRLKRGMLRQYLALKPFSVSVGMRVLGLLLVFMIASQALTYMLDMTPLVFVDPLYQSVSSVWLLVFAIVVVAPIYEEVVFRGILWSAITEQFTAPSYSENHGAIVASMVTSLIFAVIHVQYGIYEISTIVVLALIFCYARIKSGSLLLPIVLHIVNNGAAMWQYVAQST